jgi:hypothetical protein
MSETEGTGLCCIPWKRKSRTRSQSRNHSVDRQEINLRDNPVSHEAAEHSVGEQGTNTAQQPDNVNPDLTMVIDPVQNDLTEADNRSVGQQETSPHDHPVDSEAAASPLDQQEPKGQEDSITSNPSQPSVGQQETSTSEDPAPSKIAKRSLRDRLFDGATKFAQFTSAVAGASDILAPLKAASDVLGFVLQTVKVRIDLLSTKDKG